MNETQHKPEHAGSLPYHPGPPTKPHRPWSQRFVLIGPALILLYPVGVLLLIGRRGSSALVKTSVAIATLPLFALVTLVLLRPYWAFDGGMEQFWFDFSKGGRHSSIVAAHRETQRSQKQSVVAGEFDTLWFPAFRGPHRDGVVPGDSIALDWKAHPPREMWRQPVGDGWSSFAIGYGNAYTLEQRFGNEAITCYDIKTGVEKWACEYPARFTEELGGDGPRSTPTLHEDRVYALGAEGHLTCADAHSGKRIWQHQINEEFGADNLHWAMSASPYIHGNTVIVTNSGKGGGSVIAYALSDGKLAWTSDLGQQSYSSPVVADLAGRKQLLNLAGFFFKGLDPTNGKELWSYPFGTELGITGSQPIVIDENRVFISAGYGLGCAMLRIEQQDGGFAVDALWSNIRMKNKFSSSVYHDGHLYGLDERVLTCLNAETGERKWKGGRYNYGSLLLARGHLLVLGEEGELALVKASPDEHNEIARIQLFNDKTWNNPALVGGLLFARNHREMVCYDLRPVSPTDTSRPQR